MDRIYRISLNYGGKELILHMQETIHAVFPREHSYFHATFFEISLANVRMPELLAKSGCQATYRDIVGTEKFYASFCIPSTNSFYHVFYVPLKKKLIRMETWIFDNGYCQQKYK